MKSSIHESLIRNIALTISYDGSYYNGWQKQKNSSTYVTVQEEIEKALLKMHQYSIPLIGSGRTDSGVHARAQVANFYTHIQSIPAERFVPALNSILPKTIRIIKSQEVSQDFHARFSARSRTYRYFMYCGAQPLAHEHSYIWHINFWPDVQRLNAMAIFLHGELDFSTFSAAGDQSISKCRYVNQASFFYTDDRLVFEITANAFLWKMIRSLVGTLIQLEKKQVDPKIFKEILDSKNRSLAGTTAPAHGLFLWNINYSESFSVPQKIINTNL